MLRLFDLVAKQREDIEKAAFAVKAVASGLKSMGKGLVKKPMTAVGTGLGAMELHQGFTRGAGMASKARNMASASAKHPRRSITL